MNKKVNNRASTKSKSYAHCKKRFTKARNRGGTQTKEVAQTNKRYTQVIQRTKKYVTINKWRFHISTPPNNTSSYLYINYLKDIKTEC